MEKGSIGRCIKIVFVIIGTLVGAGLASGKEIYYFFIVDNSVYGILQIIFSSVIIGIIVFRVLKICQTNDINTYQDFCNIINNKIFSNLLNNIVTIFLAVSYFAMIAGFSSFIKQEFNINKYFAGGIIVVVCYLIFLKNISGLIKISDYLIPVLIIFIIIISLKDLCIFKQDEFTSTRKYRI